MGRGLGKRTKDIIDTAAMVLSEIQPTTVRSVAYKLFGLGVTASMVKSEVTRVGRALKVARERGLIRWSWIVDDDREAVRIASWDNPKEFADAAIAQYRRDRWTAQPARVEIWSEKNTVHGVLQPVLRTYGVTFRAWKGFTSATAIHEVAVESIVATQPTTPLYLGDWDPSGLFMSEVDIPTRMARYGGTVAITRIALVDGDTASLPPFSAETKKGDPRDPGWFRDRYGVECYELDAMDPVQLRARVEREIVRRLDLEVWNRSEAAERAEHESLVAVLSRWPTISMRASKYDGSRP